MSSAVMICDKLGCHEPATYRGRLRYPDKPFARCGEHLGHLSPVERMTDGSWQACELEIDRVDRESLEAVPCPTS